MNLKLQHWIFVLLISSPFASAHHSVPGVFDISQTVQWEGTITQVDWINPHIFLHFDVENAEGETVQWQLESHPPSFLRKARITKSMIRGEEGEKVIIEGYPGRDADKHIGFILKITYQDGHFYTLVNQ